MVSVAKSVLSFSLTLKSMSPFVLLSLAPLPKYNPAWSLLLPNIAGTALLLARLVNAIVPLVIRLTLVAIPDKPVFIFNLPTGLVVPIPTLPKLSILILSVSAFVVFLVKKVKSPEIEFVPRPEMSAIITAAEEIDVPDEYPANDIPTSLFVVVSVLTSLSAWTDPSVEGFVTEEFIETSSLRSGNVVPIPTLVPLL